MNILITGGAGFIGSHTALLLMLSGFEVIILDNLCNSSSESLMRVERLAGRPPIFVQGDVRDGALLGRLFAQYSFKSVLHFAGLKAVGESLSEPLRYYDNNVYGSQALLKAMSDAGVFTLVFSSSATVYGDPTQIPISEGASLGHQTNPYGRSKLMVEDMLRDLVLSDPRWHIAVLRYFNPIGAHESGLMGEEPNGTPNNLLPYITEVAARKLPELAVYGNDYPTQDGTGIRDYIHVMDLAEGHLRALEALEMRTGINVWNLGTGKGYSVLEIVRAFEVESGRQVPCRIVPRRAGDIAICYADASKAERELGWVARRGLSEMMRDAWLWKVKNPNGYQVDGDSE